MNIVIIIQAHSLSHFDEDAVPIMPDYKPTFFESIKIGLCGLDLPKPHTKGYPVHAYDSLCIVQEEGKKLDAWLLHTDSLKRGLVIAFHGYMDEKSSMLDRADVFLDMGYDVLLVNLMGAGNSYGDQTTMGYLEAENVKAAHEYAITELKEENIILTGFSMGAAAIMKAQHDYDLLVKAVILEAPYATFKGTVGMRIDKMNMPRFPVAQLFTFWFGAINGFDAFGNNPEEYAVKIYVPALLMCGGKDQYIPEAETESIFNNIADKYKKMKIFPESHHQSYLIRYPKEWRTTVSSFLDSLEKMNVFSDERVGAPLRRN